jgi:hypothetical protein
MKTLADLLAAVKTVAPHARIEEHVDGNLAIILNARLAANNSTLEPIDDDLFDAAGE